MVDQGAVGVVVRPGALEPSSHGDLGPADREDQHGLLVNDHEIADDDPGIRCDRGGPAGEAKGARQRGGGRPC